MFALKLIGLLNSQFEDVMVSTHDDMNFYWLGQRRARCRNLKLCLAGVGRSRKNCGCLEDALEACFVLGICLLHILEHCLVLLVCDRLRRLCLRRVVSCHIT